MMLVFIHAQANNIKSQQSQKLVPKANHPAANPKNPKIPMKKNKLLKKQMMNE